MVVQLETPPGAGPVAARVQVEEGSSGVQRACTRGLLGELVPALPGHEPGARVAGPGLQGRQANVDTNQELASHYQVSSILTLLVFKDGRVVARYSGVTSEAILRAELLGVSPPVNPASPAG